MRIAHHFYDSNRVATMDFERKAYWNDFMYYMEKRNAKDEGLTFLQWFLEDQIDALLAKNKAEIEICEHRKRTMPLLLALIWSSLWPGTSENGKIAKMFSLAPTRLRSQIL